MLEYLDDSVRSTEDVSKVLRLADAGNNTRAEKKLWAAPAALEPDNISVTNAKWQWQWPEQLSLCCSSLDQRSPLAEAYRRLRTSVLLSSPGRAPKTLVITSCVPSEGKSTTAINLA